MRLSVVFELLLVFLFLAFAAARVIDPRNTTKNVTKGNKKTTTLRQGPPNRYCACTSRMCNCCRDFSLPVVPLKGPGCASIMYLQRDKMMVTMSFGDRVLSNTTITGKTPKPVCMTLPGGISQFCGRIYGISRKGDQFRACLGLELRALDDIEAALRVSCFKFGPKGVKLESAPPVPVESGGKDPEEDDDDDYDLDDDDDDLIGFVDDEDDGASSEDNEVDSDSADYTGFSVLGEDILGTLFSDDSGSSSTKKKKVKKTAKPQTVVPKTSTTTRRPLLPNRRRSTIRPVSKRPLIKISKRPRPTSTTPKIVQKPPVTVSAVISPQLSVHTTSLPKPSTINLDQNIVKKESATSTQIPLTTIQPVSVTESQQKEKEQMPTEKINEITKAQTESPVTFTINTKKTEILKNDIKIPQIDLAKVEAVAAIAQQDVTSGVISSSSLTSEKTIIPEEIVTLKYEKVTPSYIAESVTSYISGATEKINSVKFVPTTILMPSSNAEPEDEDDLLDGVVNSEVAVNLNTEAAISKTTTRYEYSEDEKKTGDEHETNTVESNKIEQNSLNKKNNHTNGLKKQSVKVESEKPENDSDDDDDDDDDLLEGVLSDEDDNEEIEEDEDDNKPSQGSSIKNEVSEDEEEDDDDEDDILGEIEESQEKVKPSKVSIKKKPLSDESDNEEDDILDVLGDDDEDEESEDDNDEAQNEKDKNKVTQIIQSTTVRTKIPVTKKTTHSFLNRKPVTSTEKIFVYKEPDEKVTEKIITYKDPVEEVTEKVFIYNEPVEKTTEKVFIYNEPENKIPEKIIIYNQPIESITEKYIIHREPEGNANDKPSSMMFNKDVEDSSEESKEDSKEEDNEGERDEDNSSEEESDIESDGEKHTFVASIIKPDFSNKYGEEHELADSDDLDIEDAEDDGNDFEEDRKLKLNNKKPLTKPSISLAKPTEGINIPKTLTLSDVIGQRKKFYDTSKDNKPISTSRTHRRMNLDRLLQL